jgi:hypothetical protein
LQLVNGAAMRHQYHGCGTRYCYAQHSQAPNPHLSKV